MPSCVIPSVMVYLGNVMGQFLSLHLKAGSNIPHDSIIAGRGDLHLNAGYEPVLKTLYF